MEERGLKHERHHEIRVQSHEFSNKSFDMNNVFGTQMKSKRMRGNWAENMVESYHS